MSLKKILTELYQITYSIYLYYIPDDEPGNTAVYVIGFALGLYLYVITALVLYSPLTGEIEKLILPSLIVGMVVSYIVNRTFIQVEFTKTSTFKENKIKYFAVIIFFLLSLISFVTINVTLFR